MAWGAAVVSFGCVVPAFASQKIQVRVLAMTKKKALITDSSLD
jgi:hypothetical protein